MPPRPAPRAIKPPPKPKLSLGARLISALRALLRWTLYGALAFVLLSLLGVAVVRFVNPPVTETMLERVLAQGQRTGRWLWVDYRPLHLDELGENVARAAVASEDARFWLHHGFDLEGICTAQKKNARAGEIVAGGSTISQQVARNVFLWQRRSWLRKGLETWFTALIELILPKWRILELYLNVSETGPLRFGMEAGARYRFGRPARALSAEEAARLAALLPNPIDWGVEDAGVKKRAAWTLANPAIFPKDPGFRELEREWDAQPLIPKACQPR